MHSHPFHIMFSLLLTTMTVSAGQAYTWTDSEGITHFSESLPADVANEARQVNLPPAPVTPALSQDRVRSISEQADLLQANRLQREQQRKQRRQAEAERQQTRAQAEHRQPDHSSNGYPYYPYGYGWYPRQHYPQYPHHPGQHRYPPTHPGFQPGKTITQKRNQEALRNHHYRW